MLDTAALCSPEETLALAAWISDSLGKTVRGAVHVEAWSDGGTLFTCNAHRSLYMNGGGQLVFCCNLSFDVVPAAAPEPGREVLADLRDTPLAEGVVRHYEQLARFMAARVADGPRLSGVASLPCHWCMHHFGKLNWLADYPSSGWSRRSDRMTARPARPEARPDRWRRVVGNSMAPALKEGDFILVRPAPHPALGDIVVAPCGGQSRVHRVVRRLADGRVVTKGDARIEIDPPLPAADISGRVVAVVRPGGRLTRVDRVTQRVASRLVATLSLLEYRVRPVARAHRLVFRLTRPARRLLRRAWGCRS